MSDSPDENATGPRQHHVEVAVAAIMALLGVVTMVGSLQVGIGWAAEGPKSGFFPFYIGIAIIVASVFNLVAAAAQDPRTLFAEWSQLGSVMSVVIPTAIYVCAIPFVGIYASSIVLIALFMWWLGRYSVQMSILVSVAVMVGVFLMFEKWFLVPLPKGPIEEWLGF